MATAPFDGRESTTGWCRVDCRLACPLGSRWQRALLDERPGVPAAWRVVWALSGLWGEADVAEVVEFAAAELGGQVVADAFELAAGFPSVVGIDRGRAVALADRWRARAA